MSKHSNPVFQIKADFLPITVLQLNHNDPHSFQLQLQAITEKAPNYFTNAPVLIDFSKLSAHGNHDIKTFCDTLRIYQMQPIAARGIAPNTFLPVIPDRAIKKSADENAKEVEKKVAETMVIDKPIRAGTQIYAKNADLIVLSSVNAGAEIIADGHIHIYGPLRGRALAGASGNIHARIFCQTLEAELIAIAGHYLVNEKISAPKNQRSMLQISLHEDALRIECI